MSQISLTINRHLKILLDPKNSHQTNHSNCSKKRLLKVNNHPHHKRKTCPHQIPQHINACWPTPRTTIKSISLIWYSAKSSNKKYTNSNRIMKENCWRPCLAIGKLFIYKRSHFKNILTSMSKSKAESTNKSERLISKIRGSRDHYLDGKTMKTLKGVCLDQKPIKFKKQPSTIRHPKSKSNSSKTFITTNEQIIFFHFLHSKYYSDINH